MDGGAWQAAVLGVAKSRTRLSDFTFTFHFHALEKEMAAHSSVLAWRIPGTGVAWWAAVCGVAQSRTRLKRLSSGSSSFFQNQLYHLPISVGYRLQPSFCPGRCPSVARSRLACPLHISASPAFRLLSPEVLSRPRQPSSGSASSAQCPSRCEGKSRWH